MEEPQVLASGAYHGQRGTLGPVHVSPDRQAQGWYVARYGDGQGDLWGTDVTLVSGWRHDRNQNTDSNATLLATGPDAA